jgi:hypothetical protein
MRRHEYVALLVALRCRKKEPPVAAMFPYQIVKGLNLGVEQHEVQPTTVGAAFADRGGLAHCHCFVESDGVIVTDLLSMGSVDATLYLLGRP